MARNAIQFQDGLSLSAFLRKFGTEEQCEDAVRRWRWSDGFACPKCGGHEHGIVGKRRLYECHACGRVFHSGLVRVPQAWGDGGEAMAEAAWLELPFPEAGIVEARLRQRPR